MYVYKSYQLIEMFCTHFIWTLTKKYKIFASFTYLDIWHNILLKMLNRVKIENTDDNADIYMYIS